MRGHSGSSGGQRTCGTRTQCATRERQAATPAAGGLLVRGGWWFSPSGQHHRGLRGTTRRRRMASAAVGHAAGHPPVQPRVYAGAAPTLAPALLAQALGDTVGSDACPRVPSLRRADSVASTTLARVHPRPTRRRADSTMPGQCQHDARLTASPAANSVTNTTPGRHRRQHGAATVSSTRRRADSITTPTASPSHEDAGPTASPAQPWADDVVNTMLGRTHRQLDAGPAASPARCQADSITSTVPSLQLR
jgi:hypothetical protein